MVLRLVDPIFGFRFKSCAGRGATVFESTRDGERQLKSRFCKRLRGSKCPKTRFKYYQDLEPLSL